MNLSQKIRAVINEGEYDELYNLERLRNTFQPHINPAYNPDGSPTGLPVLDKYNPRVKGEFVEWPGAVDSRGKMWDRSDPNFEEERAKGNAWLLDDIVNAMYSYVYRIAQDLYNKYRDSNYISAGDQDAMANDMLAHLIQNPVGRDKDGNWIDQGRSPFITFAAKRMSSHVESAIKAGKYAGSMNVGRDLSTDEIGHQHSFTAPARGEEGKGTIADLVGGGAGQGWDPIKGEPIPSKLTVTPSSKVQYEIYNKAKRAITRLQDIYLEDEEFETERQKEIALNSAQETILKAGPVIISDLRQAIQQAKKDAITSRKQEDWDTAGALIVYLDHLEQIESSIDVSDVALDSTDLGIIKSMIDEADLTVPQKLVMYISYAIDKVGDKDVGAGVGEPIYHAITGELLGYKPPAAWRDTLSTGELADPEKMTSMDWASQSGKRKPYRLAKSHKPVKQKAGKFGRSEQVGGEQRGTTEVANIINSTPEYYTVFFELGRDEDSTKLVTAVDPERVLSRSIGIDPGVLDMDHIRWSEDKEYVFIVNKQTVNKVRNAAIEELKPYLTDLRNRIAREFKESADDSKYVTFLIEKINRILDHMGTLLINSLLEAKHEAPNFGRYSPICG